jgi:ribonuclease VapC
VIVDSSVFVAIVFGEPEQEQFISRMAEEPVLRISAASYLEASIVIDARGDNTMSQQFDAFLSRYGITIEPVTLAQAHIARQAYRAFGHGSGHPAKLNFGDCFSYALAKDKNEPLLFKGDDFAHTDIAPAL